MFIDRCYENESNNMSTMNNCPIVMMECPQERVCHVNTCHEVQHIVPINTRIVNHHIYKHTYVPMYTCCTEDVVCNVCDNKNL